MSSSQDIVWKVSDLLKRLDAEPALQRRVAEITAFRPECSGHAHDAEWHALGVIYHCRNLIRRSVMVGTFIQSRLDEGFERIITQSPEFQELLFEFYAMVNLGKIALDELRTYLAPVFLPKYRGQLPKSVNDLLMKGTTDCPVYQHLAANGAFPYMHDIRTCITHYRSLATGKTLVVLPDGEDMTGTIGGGFIEQRIPARVSYRKTADNRYDYGIFLPDRIFDGNGGEKLVPQFTYTKRIPLVIQSVVFARMVIDAVGESLVLLGDLREPKFSWAKHHRTSNR